ncbi:MAG: sulfurtransferase [Pyrinomonadaceae bacterium]
MTSKFQPLIDADRLASLRDSSDLILIDVRIGADARSRYLKEHLAGAFFVDLNEDLADIKPDAADGGRHPLPSFEKFSNVLKRCGITPESFVVCYDDMNGANAASRFWWMLKAAGHEKVCVLDGGYDSAVKAGFPLSSGEEQAPEVSAYEIRNWRLQTADIGDVEAARKDKDSLVIDVREADRFDGKTEPFDKIAGHIPGAVNIPFAENLTGDGTFLPPDKLREKYAETLGERKPENVIVHCGSGVTACHTLLAFEYAGLEIPKLYVGSWSEWSSNDRPIGGLQAGKENE